MGVEDFLKYVIPIKSKELKQLLKKECKISTFAKGDNINEIGKVDQYVRFLIEGAVRGYIQGPGSKDVTTILMVNPGDIIAGSRMLDGSPSEIGFEALKDSTVFSIPVKTIIESRHKYQEVIDLQMYMLSQCALFHWEARKMLYLKTARERYEWFLEHYPGLIDCVNHTYIASFLNVTPVTLSRVRHIQPRP